MQGGQNLVRAGTLTESGTAGPVAIGMKWAEIGRTSGNPTGKPTAHPPMRNRKTWTDSAIIHRDKNET